MKAEANSNVKILANGKFVKVQKSRQRKILSCVHCHSKKIKCSRIQPTCNNCNKLGLTCRYFINDRVSKGPKIRKSNINDGNSSFTSEIISTGSISLILQDAYNHTSNNNNNTNDEPREELDKNDRLEPATFINSNFSDYPKLLAPNTTNSPFRASNIKSEPFSFGLNSYPFGSNSPGNSPIQTRPQAEDLSATNSYSLASYSQQFSNLNSYMALNLYRNDSQNNREDSSTNISYLFAKANNIDSTSLQSFLERPPKLKSLEISEGSVEVSSDVSGPTNATISGESIVNDGYDLMDNPYDLQVTDSYDSKPSELSESPDTFETNHKLAHTKNFLNGTNTDYENQHLLEDLENYFPNLAKRLYELIDQYLKLVHILLPLITNFDDFKIQHDIFWKYYNPYDKESNRRLTDFNPLQFYTLYFPILYAATISEFEEYDNLLLNQDIDKYLKGFNKICRYYNYPHGLKTIPLLLGNVLIQLTSPNPSTIEMSQIIRYADFLQMNKDPVISLKIKNYEIIKFRRLLWWTIFGLDCLTSHNFCLPPICKPEDCNVVLPSDEEPVYSNLHEIVGYRLNVLILSLNIKFKYDKILNELVRQLHNERSRVTSVEEIDDIKKMINEYFEYIHISIHKMNIYHKKNPPTLVTENNLVNFIKNHSWSFVDRTIMLLHKKVLLTEPGKFNLESDKDKVAKASLELHQNQQATEAHDLHPIHDKKQRKSSSYDINLTKPSNGILSYNEHENTFQNLAESNIIKNVINFKQLNINLKFNLLSNFSYNDIKNNLVPSILHNLNDFLKYNDFLKFGKYNWYVKRTIPLDSIILLYLIIIVKFKYESITFNELILYVKLINKSLFILNRKWFKNEKYKRMLSLTNLTWEFILKKFKILHLINKFSKNSNFQINLSSKSKLTSRYEYFNYQLTGYLNTTELFKTMKVAQPLIPPELVAKIQDQKLKYLSVTASSLNSTPGPVNGLNKSTSLQSDFPLFPMSILTPTSVSYHNDELEEFIDPVNASTLKLNSSSFDMTDNYDFNFTNVHFDENDLHANEANDFELDNDFTITPVLYNEFDVDSKELKLLKHRILFDLRNNYVDINDYCAFYISLENILTEVMKFIEQ